MAGRKNNWNPSTVHRALTPEFLTPIADLLWRVQRGVADHVQKVEGDDAWVAGCTAYRRRCFALMKMATGPDRDWLWAGYIENQFAIRIHGFPIRIYRAPEEGAIPVKYMDGSSSEMALLGDALALDLKDLPAVLYRLEVHAAKLARPLNIALVEVNEDGKVANSYTIPRSVASEIQTKQPVNSVRPLRRRVPPIVPPPTEVKSNKNNAHAANDDKQTEKPA